MAGLGSLVVGFALWGFGADDSDPALNLLMMGCAALLLFGCVMRPGHRWMWFAYMKNDSSNLGERSKRAMTRSPLFGVFWRWWLHVDAEGCDLDGR